MARPAGEINSGSMADIAFLMLIFFLVTTTMDIDSGLARRLPPMPETETEQPKVNRRNIMVVLINKSDRLFAGSQPMEVSMLKQAVKDFILNTANDPTKPEKELKVLEQGVGEYAVSKGVISLQNDRGTSYDAYIRVQNELVAAFNELRDDFSMAKFGKVYISLNEEQQEVVRNAIPQNISEAEPVDRGKK